MLASRVVMGLVFFVVSVQSAHAGFKKWVDENGQVHYGDRIPSKYLRNEHSVLNEQGIVVKKYKERRVSKESLMTPEQKQEIRERQRKQQIVDAEKKLHDRVLLETFTTERDILISRDARVDAVQSQISLTETNIKNNEDKLQKLKKRIINIEQSKRKVPDNMRKEVVAVSRQLETYYQYVEAKSIEKQNIIDKFDKDIKRFRYLRKTTTR